MITKNFRGLFHCEPARRAVFLKITSGAANACLIFLLHGLIHEERSQPSRVFWAAASGLASPEGRPGFSCADGHCAPKRSTGLHMHKYFFTLHKQRESRHKREHYSRISLNYQWFLRLRSPLRRECRIASAEPVCSCAFSYVHVAHETAGAARTRSSLRPLFEGGRRDANLGRSMPRERGRISFSLHRHARAGGHPVFQSRQCVSREAAAYWIPRLRGVRQRSAEHSNDGIIPTSTPHTPSLRPHHTARDRPGRCRCSGRRCASACPRHWN